MIIRGMQYYYECEPGCKYCLEFNKPALSRFWSKVEKTSNCWIWKGFMDLSGYGKFSYFGETVFAHRFSKSIAEPLKGGTEVDHLCRNRACVNPEHLEQVDHRTNMMRSPTAQPALNARKMKCYKGHELTTKKNGTRYCKSCIKANRKNWSNSYQSSDKYREYMRNYMREYQRNKRKLQST